MKVCKVKPDKNHCYCCIDDQIDKGIHKDCDLCVMNQPDCEILSLGTTIFGKSYAFVLMGGKIKNVALDRVCYVRDIEKVEIREKEDGN